MVKIFVKASRLPFLHFGPVLLMATRNPVANSTVEVGSWNIPNYLLRVFENILGGCLGFQPSTVSSISESSFLCPFFWYPDILLLHHLITTGFEGKIHAPSLFRGRVVTLPVSRVLGGSSHDLDTWLGSPPFISHFHVSILEGVSQPDP